MRLSRAWDIIGGVAALVIGLAPGVAHAAPVSPYTAMIVQGSAIPTVVSGPSTTTFGYQAHNPLDGNRETVYWQENTGHGTYTARFAAVPGQQFTADTTYQAGNSASTIQATVQANGATCGMGFDPMQVTVHDLVRDASGAVIQAAISAREPACGLAAELRYKSPTGYSAWDASGTVDLGTVNVHATTPVYGTVVVENLGSDPITIASVAVSGDPAGVFSVASGGSCTSVPSGQTCMIKVAAGAVPSYDTYTANLTITDTTGRTRVVPLSVRGSVTSSGDFYPVGPWRIIDTRDGTGGHLTLGPGATILVSAVSGGAAAVLNVTVANATVNDFLTLYPAGASADPPTASSINFPKGAVEANAVTVANGPQGFYVHNHAGNVDVIIDEVGYYAAADDNNTNATGGQYFPHQPTRVLDTRVGFGQVPGSSEVVLPIDYGTQVNPHVRAVAANVTVTDTHGSGFLSVAGRTGDALTNGSSTLNFTAGTTVSNFALIPTTPTGGVPTISVANHAATPVDVVVDVVGYYDDGLASGGLHYTPVTPTRLLDTRTGQALGAGGTTTVTAPTGHALALNVTGVQPTGNTFLDVWPTGAPRPTSSTLNLTPGEIRSNATITGVDSAHRFSVYNFAGTTNVVVDLNGTFDPLAGQTPPTVPPPVPGTPTLAP